MSAVKVTDPVTDWESEGGAPASDRDAAREFPPARYVVSVYGDGFSRSFAPCGWRGMITLLKRYANLEDLVSENGWIWALTQSGCSSWRGRGNADVTLIQVEVIL